MSRDSLRSTALLAAVLATTTMLLMGLQAAARPGDRVAYVVFPPWNAAGDDLRRIVASGGRPLAATAWRSIFRVALRDGVLERLAASGAILAFAADRRPICGAPVTRT